MRGAACYGFLSDVYRAGGSCPLPLSLVCSHWTLSRHGWILLVLRTLARMSLLCHPSQSSHCRELLSITQGFHKPSSLGPGSGWCAEVIILTCSCYLTAAPPIPPKSAGPALRLCPSSHAPRGQSAVGKSRAGTPPGPTSSAVAPLSARSGRTRSRAVARTGAVGRRMFTAAEVGEAQPGRGRARGARGAPGRGLGSPISRAGRARR